MSYSFNLTKFSLVKLKEIITSRDLLPSQKILLDNIEENFQKLSGKGLVNLQQIADALRTKKKVEKFADETSIPNEYLTILRRYANIYAPKPPKISDFPGVSTDFVKTLETMGITTAKDFYEHQWLSCEIGDEKMDTEQFNLVKHLCEISRMPYVGPVFSRILYDAGMRKPADFLKPTEKELLDLYDKINQEKAYTKAKISLKDMHYGQLLVEDIEGL